MTLAKNLKEGIFNVFSWLGIDNDVDGHDDDENDQILYSCTML